jgi:hypothetical protein
MEVNEWRLLKVEIEIEAKGRWICKLDKSTTAWQNQKGYGKRNRTWKERQVWIHVRKRRMETCFCILIKSSWAVSCVCWLITDVVGTIPVPVIRVWLHHIRPWWWEPMVPEMSVSPLWKLQFCLSYTKHTKIRVHWVHKDTRCEGVYIYICIASAVMPPLFKMSEYCLTLHIPSI